MPRPLIGHTWLPLPPQSISPHALASIRLSALFWQHTFSTNENCLYLLLFLSKVKHTHESLLYCRKCDSSLTGSSKRLPGGSGEAPEKVLRQRTAPRLSHPNLLGDGSQRRQLWYPGPEDAPGLGVGDRRGAVPGGGAQGPHAREDQASHLLWRSDVSRGGSSWDGHYRCPRALWHRTTPPEHQRREVNQPELDRIQSAATWKCIISLFYL